MSIIPKISNQFDPEETLVLSRFLRSSKCGDEELGAEYGNYRLLEVIGKGGLGMVFRAVEIGDGDSAEVALKIPRPNYLLDARVKSLLIREGKRISRLKHPNILRVLDCSESETHPYIAMPLIRQRSLANLMGADRRPLAIDRIRKWALQLASALSYSHKKAGVIHRDLKPENVLIDD